MKLVALGLALSFLASRIVELGAFSQSGDLAAVALAQTVFLAFCVVLVTWACIWLAFRRLPQLCDVGVGTRTLNFWRVYLLALVGLVFLLWLTGLFKVMSAVLVIGLVVPGLKLMRAWIDHFFDQSTKALHDKHRAEAQAVLDALAVEDDAEEAGETRLHPEVPEFADPYATMRPIVHRAARFLFLMSAVLALSASWEVDILDLSSDRSVMGRILEILIDSIVALLLADLVWTWAKTVIDKRIADYEPPIDGQAPGPEARMATLLPLLRIILLVTLIIVVGLSVLSSAGVNVAPLIAGAGVLGVAIGFGAQSLVKDIVSGIFFLIDDAFRVGEYIELGNLRGVVESMSIRSLRVRHHRGAIHTIPFGELTSLTNYSRDWVIMKMEFRVPFETDIKQVKKIVKRIGAEMIEDPLYKDGFLEPLKSQGVRRMEEFNMVVGVKFMAKPGEQWVIRRDAYQKVVNAFEANGIRLAERNVKVEVISDRELTEAEQEAVIGAAQDSIEQQAGAPPPVSDEP